MAIKTHTIHFLSALYLCVLLFSMPQFYAEEEKAIQPMQLNICFAESKATTIRGMYDISQDFFNTNKKDEMTIRQDEFDSAKIFINFLNISNENTRIFNTFLDRPHLALIALMMAEDGSRVKAYNSISKVSYTRDAPIWCTRWTNKYTYC